MGFVIVEFFMWFVIVELFMWFVIVELFMGWEYYDFHSDFGNKVLNYKVLLPLELLRIA